MSLFVLDTDHVSLFQKNHPQVVRQVGESDPTSMAATIITAEEQLRGWFKEIRRASGSKLVWAYSRMRLTYEYFHTVQLLDFDDAAYEQYVRLRKQKIRIGTQDLRIAAIVLAVNGVLVTRNQRDFAQVPGLKLEDWTV